MRVFFLLMTYKDQLKDPRWQKMQSFIRDRDKYKCQMCGDTTTFLHVHHIYYQPKLKAWEYDPESLITLCEKCHELAHTSLPKINALITIKLIKEGATFMDIENELRKSLIISNKIISF